MGTMRSIRAILMDVHGGLFEKKTEDNNPLQIGAARRKFWAWCFEEAIRQHLGVVRTLNPMYLWDVKCDVEIRMARRWFGRQIAQRTFFDRVNVRILETVVPDLMHGLSPVEKLRIARTVRKLHRTDHTEHKIYPDVRALVHWIDEIGLALYLQTAQEDWRVRDLLRRNRAPMRCIDGTFTTNRVGANKLSPLFWKRIKRGTGFKAYEHVVIGNNAVQDACSIKAGIPALILDRDSVQERYFVERGARLYGIKFVRSEEPLSLEEPFISFARTPKELQRRLMQIITIPRTRGR